MADLQMYADHFLNEFLNEAALGVAYEAHRSYTKGTLFLDENASDEDDTKYKIVVQSGLDIFGQPITGSKKNVECLCPNCDRSMAAMRFAPHLEKCMGMGRNSSRIASQRIANSGKFASSINDSLEVDDDLDDANDADWYMTGETSRKTKKRKTDRNSGLIRNSKSLMAKSKISPKAGIGQSAMKPQLLRADQCNNSRNLNQIALHSADGSHKRSENINQTLSVWQQHIKETLPNQESNIRNKSLFEIDSGGSVGRKSKKTGKSHHSKKAKKRQVSSQPTLGIS